MDAMAASPAFTLAEAAAILDPPISERQLRAIVAALRLEPCGQRRDGRSGRPAARYPAAELMRLHAALAPWLATPERQHV
jgi:hypothetical protein